VYGYDNADRVKTVTKIASGFGSKEQLSYDYDANSNRTAETRMIWSED